MVHNRVVNYCRLLTILPQPASLTPTKQDTGKSEPLQLYVPLLILDSSSYQNYTDYFKCIAAKGDDFAPCKQFKRAYNSLCPSESLFRADLLIFMC